MRTLEEILAGTNSDKNSYHSYAPEYERLFSTIRGQVTSILEIGVREGDSLRAWAEYFPSSTVWGIDNGSEKGLPVFTVEEQQRIKLIVCDTTDIVKLTKECSRKHKYDQTFSFDIIIDDGLHRPMAQCSNFSILSPYLKPGGIFVVEDIEDPIFANEFGRVWGGEVIDLRHIRQRHDDLLWIWRKPQ